MAFQPADSLKNRTFIGLIIAQFLAGFNDQAIHAAAMFYAIHRGVLTEDQAIALMPIFFYAPWAIFCTISAYFADRFSKTTAVVIWKNSEVLISLLLMAGFFLGTNLDMRHSGVWLVMSCVFLMGMHAAFFSPAKYGAMPEILQPHVLSRGNGVLESTTFLANILGTVSGGLLSFLLHNREVWIGVILLGLSIVGAIASFLMARLPPSDPEKEFHLLRPLTNGFRNVFASRPLILSVMGIAFFIFMVSYMRATVYMHGQTRVPPWDEFHTSLIVATVALGVGLGSPLAGWLSGGKIELGLVPLGCVGMIVANVIAAILLDHQAALVFALILIGFFSGFYMVPLYSLLQHRAPKKGKGEIVAVSNFVNVTGASLASVLFFLLVRLGIMTGLTPTVEQRDNMYVGTVQEVHFDAHFHLTGFRLATANGPVELQAAKGRRIKLPKAGLKEEDAVVVSHFTIHGIEYFVVRPAPDMMAIVHNNEALPQYLFLGAAGMTLAILLLLWRTLPDFFVRTLFWMRSLGRFKIKAVGMRHLPTSGPAVLATNCDRLESCLQMISATDRSTLVVLVEKAEGREPASLLRRLARGVSIVEVPPGSEAAWATARTEAVQTLRRGTLLGVTVDGADDANVQALLTEARGTPAALIFPVWCGPLQDGKEGSRIRVVFGEPAKEDANVAELRAAILALGDWIQLNDATAGADH